MDEKTITLINSETGEKKEMPVSEVLEILDVSSDDPDFDSIAAFFGEREELRTTPEDFPKK